MKASFFTESILYWLARAVSAAAQRLPPRWNVAVGRAAGAALFYLLPGRRVVALDNLRAAFGPAYSPAEYRQILRRLFQNLGSTFLEVAAIPLMNRAYVDRWVRISPGSRERLEAALEAGKGVIFLTAHFGNWELAALTGALRGYPMRVLAREQGWPRLNRLLTEYRESKGCRVITKGFPIRELIRALREKQIVGILADQDGGRHGVLAPFFGRLASTAPGSIALALSTGAPVLPVFLVREQGPAHTLSVGEPLPIPAEGTVEERVKAGVAAYLAVLESQIRAHPDQWLWLHRRWKSCPERRIVILSDGKAGHRSQALGLAQRIERAWAAKAAGNKRLRGIPWPLTSVKTIEVRFRHPIGRLVLGLIASLAPRRFPGGEFWLRWALEPACFRALLSAHANLSISCGASTAAVHLLWAWGIRSRTIHITRVRFPSWRRFDLAVMPRHDLRGRAVPGREGSAGLARVLVTDEALSPEAQVLDGKEGRADARHFPGLAAGAAKNVKEAAWRSRLGLSSTRQIGLLLGGPARGVRLTQRQVRQAVESLLQAADRLGAELLVTSSRRTPAIIEEELRQRLRGYPRCRLLTLVGRNDPDRLPSTAEAVDCILALAQVVVVSGDSISMVSEALARRKPVVCFVPERAGRLRRESKYERFLQNLSLQGKVELAAPAEIGSAAARLLEVGQARQDMAGQAGSVDPLEEGLRRWL